MIDQLKIDNSWELNFMTGPEFYENLAYLPDPVKKTQEMSTSNEFSVYHFSRPSKKCKDKMVFNCEHKKDGK